MQLRLVRFAYFGDATIGILYGPGVSAFTLELPWAANHSDKSCIPTGEYKLKPYDSPTKGPVLSVEEVPGRTEIEIHAGNYPHDTHGCILVGYRYTCLQTGSQVLESHAALDAILATLSEQEDHTLSVEDFAERASDAIKGGGGS